MTVASGQHVRQSPCGATAARTAALYDQGCVSPRPPTCTLGNGCVSYVHSHTALPVLPTLVPAQWQPHSIPPIAQLPLPLGQRPVLGGLPAPRPDRQSVYGGRHRHVVPPDRIAGCTELAAATCSCRGSSVPERRRPVLLYSLFSQRPQRLLAAMQERLPVWVSCLAAPTSSR